MIRLNFINKTSIKLINFIQQQQRQLHYQSNSNKRLINLGNLINNYVEEILLIKPILKMPINTSERLKDLRILMKQENLNIYLIDSGDEHANEYVRSSDERRQWISGFTGSAGTALVGTEALLFTDGRYHTQAQEQLGKDWKLEKFGNPDVKSWQEHLSALTETRIGFDPSLLAIADYNTILPTLHSTSSLVSVPRNLVDEIWTDKPKATAEPVVLHDIKYSGQSSNSKIEAVRNEIKSKGRWGVIVSQLDEIAWILNLRGNDIAFNPVFFAYLLIPLGHTPTLFINIDQVGDDVYQYLTGLGILIEPYDSVVSYLENVGKQLKEGVSKIWIASTTLVSNTFLFFKLRKLLSFHLEHQSHLLQQLDLIK